MAGDIVVSLLTDPTAFDFDLYTVYAEAVGTHMKGLHAAKIFGGVSDEAMEKYEQRCAAVREANGKKMPNKPKANEDAFELPESPAQTNQLCRAYISEAKANAVSRLAKSQPDPETMEKFKLSRQRWEVDVQSPIKSLADKFHEVNFKENACRSLVEDEKGLPGNLRLRLLVGLSGSYMKAADVIRAAKGVVTKEAASYFGVISKPALSFISQAPLDDPPLKEP
ncbi:hypothetical protein GPECTOR_769g941 [Gonium pectorale]|uniref:Uncharacterized protein n=1 Tax=Gonium pectorale TaxID=33097 RepID=A0A150FU73_GONPE|nr:hypothetical protein GPECTOR_769g941 [Gonium pectorale]|eukprot:KXZ41118.1 hypothetical protein GPECTOR_769g941 [Gonium pectorale]